jgi:hypothetical protein
MGRFCWVLMLGNMPIIFRYRAKSVNSINSIVPKCQGGLFQGHLDGDELERGREEIWQLKVISGHFRWYIVDFTG